MRVASSSAGRTWALVALALIVATGGASFAQDFETVAFGDSITAAYGCVNNPPVCEFDEGSPWGNRGGYPARLSSNDSTFGLGTNYKVENKGVPGESTAEGLSRINSVLSAGYHVLLLMEGTNDVIFDGVSAETVKSNLREMDKKAVPFGTDTVFAAIIRRNQVPNDAAVTAVKDKVIQLGAERGRYTVVDTWTRLCPNTTCFNTHYYFTDPADDKAGHPDSSGYDIMAEEWHDEIAKKPIPSSAPPLLSPIGVSGEASPTFSISALGNANYYQIEVTGPGGGVVETAWHRGSSFCSDGVCDIDTGHTFGHGIHSWRARSRNPRGLGPWSGSVEVDIYPTSPAAPTGVAPSGSFCGGFDGVFSWTGVDRATDYRLEVKNSLGTVVLDEVFATGDVCSGTSCATPPQAIGNGDFTWRVYGQNPHGEGAGSAELAFDIVVSTPDPPAQISPDWKTFNTRPPFVFAEVSGTSQYRVTIDNLPRAWANAEDICENGVCTWIPASDHAVGTRNWQVQGNNCLGAGPMSGKVFFDILDCAQLEDVTIPRQTIDGDTDFSGCLRLATSPGDPGLLVRSGQLILHTGVDGVIEIANGFEVEAGAELIAVADQ